MRRSAVGTRVAAAFRSTPAVRRYLVRLLGSLGVYGAIFLVMRPFDTPYASPAVRAALAGALALSTLGAMWAIARYLVEEKDEYLRVRQTQAVLAATGLTLAVYTLWGYLAVFRLAGELPAYDIFPVFSAAWLLSVGVRRLLGR